MAPQIPVVTITLPHPKEDGVMVTMTGFILLVLDLAIDFGWHENVVYENIVREEEDPFDDPNDALPY